MTVLAYDPERLSSLHVQMLGAVDERRRVASTDPFAADAVQAVRLALDAVERSWAPLVRRLLATDPLAGGAPQRLGDIGLLRLDEAGVHALSGVLAGTDPHDLDPDGPAMRMLAEEMELIGTRPDLVQALLADLDEVSPYVAALLVSHLGLEGAQLAEVAHRIVQRWCDEVWSPELGAGAAQEFAHGTRPNAADVLFALIAADPAACVRYVELAGVRPGTLFQAGTHPEIAHRIALTATDPSRVDVATAGRLLVPLLGWFADEWYAYYESAIDDPGLPLCLVDLLAPWTMQMSPMNHDWGLEADRQRHLLDALVHDDGARDRLVANAERVRDGVVQHVLSEGVVAQEEFAAYSGMLAELIIHRRHEDEQALADSWALLLNIAGIAAGLPLGPAGNIAVGAGSTIAGSLSPYDPERAADDEAYVQNYTRTVTAALVAHEVYGRWLGDGTIPHGTPVPPMPAPDTEYPLLAFREAFSGWLAQLPGGAEGALADHIDRLVEPWVNAYEAGAETVRE
jgi:hypothetical protein